MPANKILSVMQTLQILSRQGKRFFFLAFSPGKF